VNGDKGPPGVSSQRIQKLKAINEKSSIAYYEEVVDDP